MMTWWYHFSEVLQLEVWWPSLRDWRFRWSMVHGAKVKILRKSSSKWPGALGEHWGTEALWKWERNMATKDVTWRHRNQIESILQTWSCKWEWNHGKSQNICKKIVGFSRSKQSMTNLKSVHTNCLVIIFAVILTHITTTQHSSPSRWYGDPVVPTKRDCWPLFFLQNFSLNQSKATVFFSMAKRKVELIPSICHRKFCKQKSLRFRSLTQHFFLILKDPGNSGNFEQFQQQTQKKRWWNFLSRPCVGATTHQWHRPSSNACENLRHQRITWNAGFLFWGRPVEMGVSQNHLQTMRFLLKLLGITYFPNSFHHRISWNSKMADLKSTNKWSVDRKVTFYFTWGSPVWEGIVSVENYRTIPLSVLVHTPWRSITELVMPLQIICCGISCWIQVLFLGLVIIL